jgi:hypothetical protein
MQRVVSSKPPLGKVEACVCGSFFGTSSVGNFWVKTDVLEVQAK